MISPLPPRQLILAIAPLLLLCGCGQSSAPHASSTASGEILPGSVSDAMLDTDRSQTQAPLAPSSHSSALKVDSSAAADTSAAATDTTAPAEADLADPDLPKPKPQASSKPATP